jgi:hypothetical protein
MVMTVGELFTLPCNKVLNKDPKSYVYAFSMLSLNLF